VVADLSTFIRVPEPSFRSAKRPRRSSDPIRRGLAISFDCFCRGALLQDQFGRGASVVLCSSEVVFVRLGLFRGHVTYLTEEEMDLAGQL